MLYFTDELDLMTLPIKNKQLCLLHIPKTGGTYLRQLESGGPPALSNMISIGHTMVVESAANAKALKRPLGLHIERLVTLQEMSSYCLFTCVRNHYDWLISYMGHAAGWTPQYANTHHYDYEAAGRGFEYLLNTIADRDTDIWPNRHFIFHQVFTDRGQIAVDFIVRNERMDDDCTDLARFAGSTYRIRKRQRVGIRHEDYRLYYNDRLIELVEATWGNELKLYGYSFDGLNWQKSQLGNVVAQHQKETIHYHYK